MTPKRRGALQAELERLAGTLMARASTVELVGLAELAELEQLAQRVRAMVYDQPLGGKAREAHARALVLSFCGAHRGEGEMKPAELRSAAARVAQGLADAMPEFADRAQKAIPQIAGLIAAHAVAKPRGRSRGTLERLAAVMNTPSVDASTRALCKAMGWKAAAPKSVARQRQRKKK